MVMHDLLNECSDMSEKLKMEKWQNLTVTGLVVLLLWVVLPQSLMSQEAAQPTGDSDANETSSELTEKDDVPLVSIIELRVLRNRIIPMTIEELSGELTRWRDQLKDKAIEVANLEIALLDAEGDEKAENLDALTEAKIERAAIAERMEIVVNEFRRKGGNVEAFEKYMASVMGLNFDVTDAGNSTHAFTNWLVSREGGVRLGKNIVFFILTLVVGRMVSALIGKVTQKAIERTRGGTSALLRGFLVNIVRKFIFLISLGIALRFLGVDTGPFLASVGAVGFIIGFALQKTLNNFAAGIMILLHRPYDVGDSVEVCGITGIVDSMNLASTTFIAPNNTVVIVPNGNIWGGVIKNLSGRNHSSSDGVIL